MKFLQATGNKKAAFGWLTMPLSLSLAAAYVSLTEVIKRCRMDTPSNHIIYSSVTRGGNKPGEALADAITSAFNECSL